jgi:DnaJ-class molecular chaperone
MDYYEILGVSKDATIVEIKNKYRDLAKKYHPDKNADEINKFKKINEAYQTLSDPEKKDQYDMSLDETTTNNCGFFNNGNYPPFNEQFDNEMRKLNEIFSKEPFNCQKNMNSTTFNFDNFNSFSDYLPKNGFSSYSFTTTSNKNIANSKNDKKS